MQFVRSIVLAFLVFSSQSLATATAGQLDGEGRLITQHEARGLLDRFGSIPGDGVVRGEGRLITTSEAIDVLKRYNSIPGGLVLEGKALGIEGIRTARYEPASNAFVLNDQLIYRLPISAHGAATLIRALAHDDRVGVSLTEDAYIAYGKLRSGSNVAADLRLSDGFLGDLILPPRDWTIGYKLASSFVPREDIGNANVTVFFRLRDFAFAAKDTRLELERASLDVRIVPVLQQQASDGGYLPDYKAIELGAGFDAYAANAEHVGANIGYYLQEPIVARALAHGEATAFFRELKASGIDLRSLVRRIETASGKSVDRLSAAGKLDDDWMGYLKEIQDARVQGNWSAAPYDLYLDRKRAAPVKNALAPVAR